MLIPSQFTCPVSMDCFQPKARRHASMAVGASQKLANVELSWTRLIVHGLFGNAILYSSCAVNCHALEPLVMSIVNKSSAATAKGTLVSATLVVIVPLAVPCVIVGSALNTSVPFCLILKVRSIAASDALTTILHLMTCPACRAIRIGPTFVPGEPSLMMNPTIGRSTMFGVDPPLDASG